MTTKGANQRKRKTVEKKSRAEDPFAYLEYICSTYECYGCNSRVPVETATVRPGLYSYRPIGVIFCRVCAALYDEYGRVLNDGEDSPLLQDKAVPEDDNL